MDVTPSLPRHIYWFGNTVTDHTLTITPAEQPDHTLTITPIIIKQVPILMGARGMSRFRDEYLETGDGEVIQLTEFI